jgi:uncharacterized membrane protein
MTASSVTPRRDWLRWAGLVLAGLGALDAIYLTYIKLAHARAAFCQVGGGCDVVNSSAYSTIQGIPLAVFGLGMYLAVLGVLALENRAALLSEYGRLAVFGLALTGTLYSAYLTYLELYVIHAICPYCVVSAVLVTLLLGVAVMRLAQADAAD